MPDSPDTQVLKPCPFCGDELRVSRPSRVRFPPIPERWRLLCMSDNDCFFMDFDTEAEALEMGNRRSPRALAAKEEGRS